MAGAKETPRQKLISLMYLVFITMLALNVSKEVLDGFGQMFVKIADANNRISESNNLLLENIAVNATEKGGKWIGHKRTADEIQKESDAFFDEIQKISKQHYIIHGNLRSFKVVIDTVVDLPFCTVHQLPAYKK